MSIYRVYYDFDGVGYVNVEADNEEDAKDKFYNAEYYDEPFETGHHEKITNVIKE